MEKSSPYINRFTQPDTLIPDPSNPQAFNRYSYVSNNPINFNDPSGHCSPTGDNWCFEEYYGGVGGVPLSTNGQDLTDFADSVEMTPEEVIGIGLGHEMFGDSEYEREIHMQAFRNGFLRYADVHCYGIPSYNCMLNYFSGSYESVYNQFLSKESEYEERTKFWGHRDDYLFVQHVSDNGLRSNLSEDNQDIVDVGKEFMASFMGTISQYHYDPELPLNSGVVNALAVNKALGGYPTYEMGFYVIKRVTCPNTGVAGYSLIYNRDGEMALDAADIELC